MQKTPLKLPVATPCFCRLAVQVGSLHQFDPDFSRPRDGCPGYERCFLVEWCPGKSGKSVFFLFGRVCVCVFFLNHGGSLFFSFFFFFLFFSIFSSCCRCLCPWFFCCCHCCWGRGGDNQSRFPFSLLIDLMKRPKDADFILKCTLPGTNISRIKALLKMTFLFARWDMLVPKVHFWFWIFLR